MLIRMYWPNCTLNNKGIDFDGKDALFLECSLDEARKQLFGRLTPQQIGQCLNDYMPKTDDGANESEIRSDMICFLITMDQNTLLPEPWWFPYAGQWNGYSPFREIIEVKIKDIGELLNISVVP